MLDTDKKVISPHELAALLGIGRNTCYTLIKEKHFHSVRVGRRILISTESVNHWLNGDEKAEVVNK